MILNLPTYLPTYLVGSRRTLKKDTISTVIMSSPIKSVLLVIDIQEFFTAMTEAALPKIQTLIRHFNSKNLPVILTQHGHDETDLSGPPYFNQLVRKWGPDGSIHLGSKDWELQPSIKKLIKEELGGDIQTIRKNTYDAFVNTDLDERLRSMKVERVVVCGCMTDCCVDTTARGAFNRGWETVRHVGSPQPRRVSRDSHLEGDPLTNSDI